MSNSPHESETVAVALLDAQQTQYDTVQIDQSAFIASISCSGLETSIKFNEQGAFEVATQKWSQGTFVLVTTESSCGGQNSTGLHSFMLIDQFTKSSEPLTILAEFEVVDLGTTVGYDRFIEVEVGDWTPAITKDASLQSSSNADSSWQPLQDTPLALTSERDWTEEMNFDTMNFGVTRWTQWGKAYQIYTTGPFPDNVNVFCVDCGLAGNLTVTGNFKFSLAEGMTDANIHFMGPLRSTYKLGVIAGMSTRFHSHTPLVQIPLGSINIPGILSIGPEILVTAGSDLNIKSTGTMLVGAVKTWPTVDVFLDLINHNQTAQSGFGHSVISPLEVVVGESMGAVADTFLSASVGFEVLLAVPGFEWTRQVALVEQVMVVASAVHQPAVPISFGGPVPTTFANATVTTATTLTSQTTSTCTALSVQVNAYDKVYVDYISLYTQTLTVVPAPAQTTCIE